MFGHLPATSPHAIRTGSWLAREALNNARGLHRYAAASCVIAVSLTLAPSAAHGAGTVHAQRAAHGARRPPPEARRLPYPDLAMPLQISGGQYVPVAWADVAGWSADDHLAAYKAFRISCKPISAL